MNKFAMKSTAALMCAMVIGSTTMPTMAADQQNTSTPISQTGTIIETKASSLSISTSSTSDSIKVWWTRPGSAVKYIVTCGSQAQTVNSSAKSPTVTFRGLSPSTNYRITVTAYNSSGSIVANGSTTASTF